jgi:hypothetical protein
VTASDRKHQVQLITFTGRTFGLSSDSVPDIFKALKAIMMAAMGMHIQVL